jgi:hypothetical protein
MEDVVESLTRGNVAEVKVLLASIALALGVYGFEDDQAVHAVAGSALLAVLALKVIVVRRDFGLGRFLPLLGISWPWRSSSSR